MFFGYCFLFRFCDVVNRCCSWYISPSSLFFFLETKNHTWPLVCTHFISRLNVLGYTFPSWFSLLFLLTLNLLISNPLVVYVSQDQYRRSSVDTSFSRSRCCKTSHLASGLHLHEITSLFLSDRQNIVCLSSKYPMFLPITLGYKRPPACLVLLRRHRRRRRRHLRSVATNPLCDDYDAISLFWATLTPLIRGSSQIDPPPQLRLHHHHLRLFSLSSNAALILLLFSSTFPSATFFLF